MTLHPTRQRGQRTFPHRGTVLLAGVRVDTAIRAEGISSAASKVAAHPAVRNALRQCPQPELRIVINNPHLILSFPGTPSTQAELHGPIDVVLAAGKITTA